MFSRGISTAVTCFPVLFLFFFWWYTSSLELRPYLLPQQPNKQAIGTGKFGLRRFSNPREHPSRTFYGVLTIWREKTMSAIGKKISFSLHSPLPPNHLHPSSHFTPFFNYRNYTIYKSKTNCTTPLATSRSPSPKIFLRISVKQATSEADRWVGLLTQCMESANLPRA